MGLAPARGAPRVGDSAPRVPAALVLSDLVLWLILYNFSQTEIREGGFALFWTRPAAADRPLGPRRAAPAEDGLLAPAGRQPLHRWAAQVCSAGALGLLPSLPLRSRLGHGQGSVRGDRRPGQRWDQMPWGSRGPCSAGQCLGQRGGARRCRSRIRSPSGRAPLPGGASWLQRLALWRLPPPDAAFPPALDLRQQKGRFPEQHQRLSLGCPVLDGLLRGGLPLGGITELAGRSSAGKTQLALQLCLAVQFPWRLGGLEAGECRPVVEGRGGCTRSPCGSDGHCPSWLGPGAGSCGLSFSHVAVRCLRGAWPALPHVGPEAPGCGLACRCHPSLAGSHTSPQAHGRRGSPGAMYVCTEDAFPDRRLQQLIAQQRHLRTDAPGDVVEKINFGDHIFIEHVADVVSICRPASPRLRGGTSLDQPPSPTAWPRCALPGAEGGGDWALVWCRRR